MTTSRTVLVVDASPLSAARAEEALRGTGFEVAAATNQAEAEAVVATREISAALTAVSFPKGNGYDLARQVRARHPEAVVFVLSGAFEVYNGERARAAGIYGRIPRPLTVDALRRQLEGVLGSLTPSEEARPSAPAPGVGPAAAGIPSLVVPPSASASSAATSRPIHVPIAEERLATFLPRDFKQLPVVAVDPEVVSPALERAILEVLPEVVESVLARAFHSSAAFRSLVEVAVEEAVRAEIGTIARRVIQERMAEIEAAGDERT